MTTLTAAEIVALQETLAAAVALSADLPSGAQSAITAAAVQAAYAQSLVLTATPPPTPNLPAAPTSFAAAVSGNTIGLTWVNAPGTTTGAVIKRDGTQIGTVLAGVATYTDQQVAVGSHTYTVANTNSFGTGPTASTTGAVASAATLTLASIATQSLVMGSQFTPGLSPVAAGGTAPYTWATSAALPKGLVLTVTSNTTATISGTPSAAATTSVTLTVTDSTAGTPQTASRTFSIVVANPPSLTITEPTGFPITSSQAGPATATMPHAYAQVGDLAIANVIINSASVTVSGITSPNAGPWTRSLTPLQDTLLAQTLEQWSAPVTTAGVVDTPALTYSGSATVDIFLDSKEGAGATSMWQVVTSGQSTSGNPSGGVTTMTYPSLVPATTSLPQCYVGLLVSGNVAEGGSSSGFIYVDSTSGNEMIYKLSTGTGPTPVAPTSTQLAGWYDAIAVIYELTSSGLSSSVLAIASVTTQTDTVNVAAPTLTLSTSGGTGTKTFAVTSGTLPTGMALNASTGVISGTPTKVGSSAITITVTDSTTPTAQTAATTFTINVAAAAAPPAAGSPNVPAGTTVPLNVLANFDFVAMFDPTASPTNADNKYGGLDLVHFQPWMYGPTSQNPGQTFALKDSSGNPLTIVKADGCHIGFDASNQTSGCIASAKGAQHAPGTGTYTGFNIGPPTAAKPIFGEMLVQFINNGSALPGWQTAWYAGDPQAGGSFPGWPPCGEFDVVETGLAHPGKPGWTAIAGFFATGAFAGKQNNGPGGTAESVTAAMLAGAITLGMLWTTQAVTFFYGGQQVGSQLIANGSAGYNNFGVTGYVPWPMFPVVFPGASGESPDLSGRTDMVLKRITVWGG